MTRSRFSTTRIYTCIAAVALLASDTGTVSRSAEITRCNAFNDAYTAWTAVMAGSDQPLPLRSVVPPTLLPDGTEFRTWEQPAEHQRTFFVARNQSNASDDNPGTEDRPWKTIGRAAALLEPGDRVIVKQGLYREWVRPARGGMGPERMITYQAAPKEKVVVTGSEPLTGQWSVSALADHSPIIGTWMIDLPATLFQDCNPFAESNVTAHMMTNPYATRHPQQWDKPPYSLPQGLVFQGGERLVQVAEYEGLAKEDGAYWVEPGGRRLHVRPFGDEKPNDASFEVTTRPFGIAPEKAGLGFIRIDGFTVEHVASCYPMPQQGAISTKQGHHWIVENNIVRQVNSLGLDYGRRQTFMPYEAPEDTPKLGGVGTIVRRNAFLECGVCSMQGLGLIGGLIEDNYARGCGWQNAAGIWEAAGIKLHYLKHTLVRRNVVDGTVGAAGMWIDHSNANSRITANIIVGASSQGLFLEASYKPNLIDQNIVWDCRGNAYYQMDSGETTVVNNLFGCCDKSPVTILRAPKEEGSTRVIDIENKRTSLSERSRVLGNIFYGFGEDGPGMPDDMANVSDYNVFVNPPDVKPFNLAEWQKTTGQEAHSITFVSRMEFARGTWTLRQAPVLPDFPCPHIYEVTSDFFGTLRPAGDTIQAGPFLHQDFKPEMLLHAPVPIPEGE